MTRQTPEPTTDDLAAMADINGRMEDLLSTMNPSEVAICWWLDNAVTRGDTIGTLTIAEITNPSIVSMLRQHQQSQQADKAKVRLYLNFQ